MEVKSKPDESRSLGEIITVILTEVDKEGWALEYKRKEESYRLFEESDISWLKTLVDKYVNKSRYIYSKVYKPIKKSVFVSLIYKTLNEANISQKCKKSNRVSTRGITISFLSNTFDCDRETITRNYDKINEYKESKIKYYQITVEQFMDEVKSHFYTYEKV